jgi:creatinine amidohydrolase
LGTDAFIARIISKGVAERLNAFCLPPVWYGIALHHMNFAGSITVRPRVLSAYVLDILESLAAHKMESILVLNAHGGNTGAINAALVEVRENYPDIFLAQSSVWLALQDVYETLPEDVRQDSWRTMISHGGLFETSVVMAVEEGLVKLDGVDPASNAGFVQATDPAMTLTVKVEHIAPRGFGGDPREASAELGRRFIELSVEAIISKYEKACSLLNP